MKITYKCDTCGREFRDPDECEMHEVSHGALADDIKQAIISKGENLCDYCEHAYYAYGCERDCAYDDCRNRWRHPQFKPTYPLRNKRPKGETYV